MLIMSFFIITLELKQNLFLWGEASTCQTLGNSGWADPCLIRPAWLTRDHLIPLKMIETAAEPHSTIISYS